MNDPIVLICSVELEMAPLLARITSPVAVDIAAVRAWGGSIEGVPVLAVAGGMGKVNAAHALTVVLQGRAAAGVLGFGVGGAYPGRGLAPGDLAVATSETYGDEGVATRDGWISCEGIGIPLHVAGERALYNRFPVDEGAVDEMASRLARAGPRVVAGPFVTVSCCSGTAARGAELADRFGAVCETMEGAAYAHISARYTLPFLEVRGISNLVEDRDLARWRLREAASAAAAAVARAVPAWSPKPQVTIRR